MAKTYLRTKEGTVFTTDHPEYHHDCERLSQAAGKEARKEYCRAELRKLIKAGQTVYCMLRSVSASGMSRRISLYIVEGAAIRNIDTLAADAIGWTLASNGGIKVGGCGMDMGFHTVYTLSRALFPDGFGIKGKSHNGVMEVYDAPNTPEQAAEMIANGFRFSGRNGDTSGWDNDGGYALRHSWM